MVSLSRLCVALAVIFLPLMLNGTQAGGPPDRYICTPPPGFSINLENSSAVQDRTGAVFCSTRPSSGIGGIVWRMDDYVDAEHPGTPRLLLGGDPAHAAEYFGNSPLLVGPDGYLRFPSVVVNNTTERRAVAIVSYLVPEWTPDPAVSR